MQRNAMLLRQLSWPSVRNVAVLTTRRRSSRRRIRRMKPTVFLSHSSRDQAVLGAFKTALEEKTGRAVQFFLSSDGQSIPLGRNWVHRIEQALDSAAMMIVFLSPASITSQWIFFEAGYAHSKGVRVVPVAFAGFDMAHLKPPLSLLQGFNLRGADGMNNIITLINQQFDFAFSEDFDDTSYFTVFGAGVGAVHGAMASLDEITLTVHGDVPQLLEAARGALTNTNCDHAADEYSIRTHGASFVAAPRARLAQRVEVAVDPALFEVVRSALDSLLPLKSRDAVLDFRFSRSVASVQELHKISALLYGTGVAIGAHESFVFEGLTFSLDVEFPVEDERRPRPLLQFGIASNEIGSGPQAIAELLLRRGVLLPAI